MRDSTAGILYNNNKYSTTPETTNVHRIWSVSESIQHCLDSKEYGIAFVRLVVLSEWWMLSKVRHVQDSKHEPRDLHSDWPHNEVNKINTSFA